MDDSMYYELQNRNAAVESELNVLRLRVEEQKKIIKEQQDEIRKLQKERDELSMTNEGLYVENRMLRDWVQDLEDRP